MNTSTAPHNGRIFKLARFVGLAMALYVLADVVYIAKTTEGIDLLPPQYGHHGWMFIGSDWAVHKIETLRRA